MQINRKFYLDYKKNINKFLLLFLILIIIYSLLNGAIFISPKELFHPNDLTYRILVELRVPRILTSILAGGCLAVSGVIMQGLFKNSMADPALIGISSGASLFTIIFMILTNKYLSSLPYWIINWGQIMSAFSGSFIITSIIYILLINKSGNSNINLLILSGIAINALCGSLIGLLLFKSNDDILKNIVFWNMGSLSNSNYFSVLFIGVALTISLLFLNNISKFLNSILIGETYAFSIGMNIKHQKHIAIFCVSLLVGTTTSFVGPIGFVGLITPHILRLLFGNEQRKLIIMSIFYGAGLLTLSDLISRILFIPQEIPIGIITSLIGAPYFIYLLYKQRNNGFL